MDFISWLQGRLIAHGARITVDGDWGRSSIKALRQFQESHFLPVTGVADRATIDRLKRDPIGDKVAPMPVSAATAAMPPWMAEIHRKMGLHEVKHNGPLIEFLKLGKFLGNPANLPWCGDLMESAFAKTLPEEVLPSNPFFAQAWKDFGIDAGGPIVGAVGVIKWDANSGHVGTVAGISGDRVNLLGGNQSNEINISSFQRSKFIAWRWPKTFPIQHYPALQGQAAVLDRGSTR